MITTILPNIDEVQLTPLLLTPSETKTDFEILFADREALALLVQGILDNKRLAWIVVDSWLNKHNYLLIEADPKDEPQLDQGLLQRWTKLTPREQEIALLAARNLTNREIAYKLTISPETVKTHVRHVCEKLDLIYKRDLTGALMTNGLTEGKDDVYRGS